MLDVKRFVEAALLEDTGRGDLFWRCACACEAGAFVRSKSSGIFAGEVYARELLRLVNLSADFKKHDGDAISPGDVLLKLNGEQRVILSAERTLLNILQHASGIASLANAYARALQGGSARLLDTRKTRPLLREFEKYASRIGGATNHRMGLDDCLMLKDTHLKTITDLGAFIQNARKNIPVTALIEVECEDPSAAKVALKAGADIIMCDNMSLEQTKEVLALRAAINPAAKVEASGNITLQTIGLYKDLGVDYVSTGSPIHQAVWLDFSMKMQ